MIRMEDEREQMKLDRNIIRPFKTDYCLLTCCRPVKCQEVSGNSLITTSTLFRNLEGELFPSVFVSYLCLCVALFLITESGYFGGDPSGPEKISDFERVGAGKLWLKMVSKDP